MKIEMTVVPPNGGEADYSFTVDMPSVPRAGEHIMLNIKDEGMGVFRVLYITHMLEAKPLTEGGHSEPVHDSTNVQIEVVDHPMASGRAHLNYYFERPQHRGKVHKYPASGY
jgi:hypothetical protein